MLSRFVFKAVIVFGLILLVIGIFSSSLLRKLYENDSGLAETSSDHSTSTVFVESNMTTFQSEEQLLSPSQKIAQTFAVSLVLENENLAMTASKDSENVNKIMDIYPGFVILYGRALNFDTIKNTTKGLSLDTSPYPIIVGVDHEGGLVQRAKGSGFTILPSWQELCRMDSVDRNDLLTRSASELSQAGIQVVLGPVVDHSLNSDSSLYLEKRICSANSDTLVESAMDLIDLYQQVGITPVLKHFPGIGDLTVDLHDSPARISETEAGIEIFRRVLSSDNNQIVMTSHAILPNESLPCSLSPQCLRLLRSHSESLIMTDSIDMVAAQSNEAAVDSLTWRAKNALIAGNTIVLFGPDVSFSEIKQISQELEMHYYQDSVFAAAVDNASQKIIYWKQDNN